MEIRHHTESSIQVLLSRARRELKIREHLEMLERLHRWMKAQGYSPDTIYLYLNRSLLFLNYVETLGKKVDENRFKVLKLKHGYIEAIIREYHGEGHTKVNLIDYCFSCSCPHHRFRKALCKHVLLLLELYAFLRNEARDLKLIENFLETYRSRLF